MFVTNFPFPLPLFISLFFLFFLPLNSTPYLSPTTLLPNYQNMLHSFKIYTYTPPHPSPVSSSPSASASLFISSLLNSSFITPDPEKAHLFFIPISDKNISTRSLSRVVNSLRYDFPFWNRTLGADHFYVSCEGVSCASDRNVLELKKNAVQVSCFPTARNKFVPHKDITLPPFAGDHAPEAIDKAKKHLGYVRYGAIQDRRLVQELSYDPEFLVDTEPLDELTFEHRLGTSKFCLFDYGSGDASGVTHAVRFGCVPVVITDRPIQDLPLVDVLRWQAMAVFVGWNGGEGGVKAEELKRVLVHRMHGERYEKERRLCMTGGKHFVWNEQPQPYDAFHMAMYQLWLRRHTIRYARREVA